MQHPNPASPTREQRLASLTALFAALALSACGGNSDDGAGPPVTAAPAPPPVAGTPAPPPAPAVSTTVSGAVVKGPVAGAQVCGYAVAANGRGSGLGSCTTTDASGNYTLTVPAGSGPLWVEATGGTYTDEATAATVSLPAGSPLTALVTANGSAVTTMLTPLTTLALNAARANAGTSGTLDATAFNSAATQLLSSFNLPATLNISTTVPAFGTNANSYGTALAAVSQMVANGSTLASILAAANPQALAAAFATAAAPPVASPPPSSPPTGGVGAVTASGSFTGGSETFVPRGNTAGNAVGAVAAFSTAVGQGAESYTFNNTIRGADATGTSAGVAAQSITVNRLPNGQTTATFIEITLDRGAARSLYRYCNNPCTGVSLTPTTSGSGITLTLANASFEVSTAGSTVTNPPTTPALLNGSLTGEMPGGYAFLTQLPRTTAGTLSLAGAAAPILFGEVGYTGFRVPDPTQYPTVTLHTAQGDLILVTSTDGTTTSYNARFVTRGDGEIVQAPVTASALVKTATGYTLNLNGVTLTGSGPKLKSLVVTAQVNVSKVLGSVAIGGDGSFTGQTEIFRADSQTLIYDFRATSSTLAYASVEVRIKGGALTSFSAISPSGKTYNCDSVGSMFMAKCAGTVTVGADGRTLTFTGFKAGLGYAANATVSFDGSLTSAGL